ncbi:hypothetical protein SAMN05216223_107363 [Actinacidiphila yanglinensis]|uniref:Uncharacterized protein n=1 Tax=Actinacidiphila yanglinensis TaxID=310779 RepID=A0A1H6BYI2_9ACTN|nr:hypothetical protein [Actinacidiphila yanglinensis]SEG65713.1 hypothetical protein SAMN05216223_107363 [Actinacidiphila yanglinensis]
MAITEVSTQPAATDETTGTIARAAAGTATKGADAKAATAKTAGAKAILTKDTATADCSGGYRPVPVWFFAFEGLFGASYDIIRTSPHAWIVVAVAIAVNVVLARTALRGRLRTARAMLRGRRTRKIAVCLIALRVGVHFVLGAIGVEATTPAAHIAFALLMCATTVTLLTVEQRIMLRALDAAS